MLWPQKHGAKLGQGPVHFANGTSTPIELV